MKNSQQEWQISYIIEGLIAPVKGVFLNEDIFFKRGRHIHEAQIFLRINDVEKDEGLPKIKALNEILQLYAVETLRYSYVADELCFIKTPINEKMEFGGLNGAIPINPSYSDEQLSDNYDAFKYLIEEYDDIKDIFVKKEKKSLRIAFEYFYKSFGETSIENRLIDLMIALEALFSGGYEIRYRVSLRIAIILGFIGRNKKEVFETVKKLYDKRSKIVHGSGDVEITYEELYMFEGYVQNCCRIFTYINEDNKKINDMIDDSLIMKDVEENLKDIVIGAYEKWKKTSISSNKLKLTRQIRAKASIEFIPK